MHTYPGHLPRKKWPGYEARVDSKLALPVSTHAHVLKKAPARTVTVVLHKVAALFAPRCSY